MINEEYQKKKDIIQSRFYDAFPLCFPKQPECGFSIGEGWYSLVEQLCSDIEKELKVLPKEFRNFQVHQVKEKFGGLRFYYGMEVPVLSWKKPWKSFVLACKLKFGPTPKKVYDNITKLVSKAESDSFKICEVCGEPGEIRSGGWLVTLCDEHQQERLAKK